jgi:HK97 family phage major capsid protein/HK97 family phage prohead protease
MMTNRAYSVLTIKSVDGDKHTITGVATTPTTDRLGDIIEPLGVSFTNPLPLLLYHDSQRPVGQVKMHRPTEDGIEFTATIPPVAEAGALKDRIDEAWQSLKAGLIRGVSIGFRAIEHAFTETGIRFLKTEVLELSLVAIPANADATIHTIKSFSDRPAQSGLAPASLHQPAGAGTRQTGLTMKTIAQQMAELQTKRTDAATKAAEIMQPAVDEGRTLDATQQKAYDEQMTIVRDCDGHVARLEEFEALNAKAARPVDKTPQGRSQIVFGKSETEKLPQGIPFARYLMCLVQAKGNPVAAIEVAKHRYPGMDDLHRFMKAAVMGGTVADSTWAGNLVDAQTFLGDFIDFLRPLTVVGKFGTNGIPSLRRIPFNVNIKGQTSGGQGYWVGEAQAKPLTAYDFSNTNLTWAKVAAIAVISEELARFSNPSAEMLVRDALAASLVARIDQDFLDPDIAPVANVHPGAITNGIVALAPSGTNLAAVITDLQTIFAAFIAANNIPTNGVWIMTNTTALALSLMTGAGGDPAFPNITMTGGTLKGLPVIASQYALMPGSPADNLLILCNASDIYLADDGQVSIDVSREASLEMDDAPTGASAQPVGSPTAPTAASLVSMWQTDSIAIKAERYINWQRRRASAVSFLKDVKYAA